MRKALVRKGFLLAILLAFVLAIGRPAAAAGPSFAITGQEHPGLAGQPAGNKAIGKVLWQPIKLVGGVGIFLDKVFRGDLKGAAYQAVTAPFNYPASVVTDGATLVVGDTKVYGSPGGHEFLKLASVDKEDNQPRAPDMMMASAYGPGLSSLPQF
jgi:hypothetical protein